MTTVQHEKRTVPCLTAITMSNNCRQSIDQEKHHWLHDHVGRDVNKPFHAFMWYKIGIAMNNAYIPIPSTTTIAE